LKNEVQQIGLKKWASEVLEMTGCEVLSGHTAYRHASLIYLLLTYQISLKSKKLFVDGRTY